MGILCTDKNMKMEDMDFNTNLFTFTILPAIFCLPKMLKPYL